MCISSNPTSISLCLLTCRTLEELQQTLLTNVVGTFSVTKAFLPLLKVGQQKTIVHTSSIASSLSNNASFVQSQTHSDAGMALSYRISKVSINMGELHNSKCVSYALSCCMPSFMHT